MADDTQSTNDAPDPDSEEFLQSQNPVDKLTPNDMTADEATLDADAISTDPTPSDS